MSALEERGTLDENRNVDEEKFYKGMMKKVRTVEMPELSDAQIQAARERRRQSHFADDGNAKESLENVRDTRQFLYGFFSRRRRRRRCRKKRDCESIPRPSSLVPRAPFSPLSASSLCLVLFSSSTWLSSTSPPLFPSVARVSKRNLTEPRRNETPQRKRA